MLLLLLPATRLVAPWWAWHPDGGSSGVSTPTPVGLLAPAAVSSSESLASPPPKASAPSRLARIDATEWLMMLWAGGAALLLFRRAMGSWQLRGVLRRSKPAKAGPLLRTFHQALADEPLRRRVRLRVSPTCLVPVTWGVWRPVILLPVEAEGWSAPRCCIVLGHELAHIRRGDFAWRTLAQFVCALHWCNPLAWFAERRLRLAQEQACDDLVLRSGTDPADYAAELVESVRRFQFLPPTLRHALAMAQPSTLETRVGAVMDERRDRSLVGRWPILASTFTVPMFLVGSALAQITAISPPASTSADAAATKDEAPRKAAADVLMTRQWRFPLVAAVKLDPTAKWVGPDRIDGTMKALLESRGVSFPEGAALHFDAGASLLVLRNSQANFDRVDKVLDEAIAKLSPVERKAIEAELAALEAQKEAGIVVMKKARALIIPKLDLKESTIEEAVDLIVEQGREVDHDGTGVNVTFAPGWDQPATPASLNPAKSRLTVSLSKIPFDEALRYVTGLAGLKFRADAGGFTILPVNFAPEAEARLGPPTAGTHAVARDEKLSPASAPTEGQQAARIVIPLLDFSELSLAEAVKLLNEKARAADPAKPGTKVYLSADLETRPSDARITLRLKNIPLEQAVRYITGLASLEFERSPDGIKIVRPENAAAAEPRRTRSVPLTSSGTTMAGDRDAVQKRAAGIVIPRLELREASLEEAVKLLGREARASDPERRGINIAVMGGPGPNPNNAGNRITVDLKNISPLDAMRHIAQLAGMTVQIERHGLLVVPVVVDPTATPGVSPGQELLPGQDLNGAPAAKEAATLGPLAETLKATTLQRPSATKPPFFDPAVPINISANETKFLGGLAVAKGDASLQYKEVSITAQKLDYDSATKIVRAQGTVKYSHSTNTVDAEALELDLMTGRVKVVGPHKTIIRDSKVPAQDSGPK
jgi:beta-lactamase regulating signal transducer with metallopeptidase domain